MKERLWTKTYLFSLLLVFGVNMGYALLNSVMVIYGQILTTSNVIGGYMISVFTLSALVSRLFIKKLSQKYSNKVLLIFGLTLATIAGFGYYLSNNVALFLLFRALHGIGFGIGLTCATAISNEVIPTSRLSEGVGFTSSANTIANAIGPTIALTILGKDYSKFSLLFLILAAISGITMMLSFFINEKRKEVEEVAEIGDLKKGKSYMGIIVACVFFIITFAQSAVNSYVTSYAKEMDFGNIGVYFTITAVVTFCSRFFSRKIQDLLGIRKMTYLLLFIAGVLIITISIVKNPICLYILGIPYGMAFGLLTPLYNYRIIQTVDRSQFAFAISIYYCALDAGYGIGAIVWGVIVQQFSYQFMFICAGLLLLSVILIDSVVHHKYSI